MLHRNGGKRVTDLGVNGHRRKNQTDAACCNVLVYGDEQIDDRRQQKHPDGYPDTNQNTAGDFYCFAGKRLDLPEHPRAVQQKPSQSKKHTWAKGQPQKKDGGEKQSFLGIIRQEKDKMIGCQQYAERKTADDEPFFSELLGHFGDRAIEQTVHISVQGIGDTQEHIDVRSGFSRFVVGYALPCDKERFRKLVLGHTLPSADDADVLSDIIHSDHLAVII